MGAVGLSRFARFAVSERRLRRTAYHRKFGRPCASADPLLQKRKRTTATAIPGKLKSNSCPRCIGQQHEPGLKVEIKT
jgi:hypothetical protein